MAQEEANQREDFFTDAEDLMSEKEYSKLLNSHPVVGTTLRQLADLTITAEEAFKIVAEFNDKYCKADKIVGFYQTYNFPEISPDLSSVRVKFFQNGNVSVSAARRL